MTRKPRTPVEKRVRDDKPRTKEQQLRLRRAQRRARKYVSGVSLADELLSERRREAANE